MEITIPKNFERKFKELLRDDWEKLIKCLEKRPLKSIRINTLKISKEKLIKRLKKKGWKLKKIPWIDIGFFVERPEDIARTLEFFLGYYYIQEASSMIPPLVLNPKPGELVLDLCAAPGSKTTQIAAMMENKGIIVANDDDIKRIRALCSNLQKCGVKNCIVTVMDGRKFWRKGLKFDRILVDVPCSGSGTIITTYSIFKTWSQSLVLRLSKLQKQLLQSASKCLKKDGILVYSTCSMDPEENEFVIDYAVKKLGLEIEEIKIKGLNHINGLTEWRGKKLDRSIEKCIRIHPYHNFTEGFFIARLRR